MAGTREFLRSIGLPAGDLGGLPDSAKRFPDDAYPAGSHLEATTVAFSRERVRRARLGLDILARSSYPEVMSELGAEGLAVPLAA